MPTRSRRRGALLATLLLFGAAPAAAQQTETAEARQLFREGLEYAAEERWGEALEYFRRSEALVPRPSTRFNMALAQLRLGRARSALATLEALLRDSGTSEAQRQQALQLTEMALRSLAHLRLDVAPADATVRIDGELQEGEGGVRQLRLDPGTHRLQVAAEGFREELLEIAVLDGAEARRSISLTPLPLARTELRVTSAVASAVIRLDGAATGQGAYVGEVAPGEHEVLVEADGYEPFRRRVQVGRGERVALQAALVEVDAQLTEEPWFWALTLGGGALVVGGVVLGVVLATTGDEDPYGGTTGVVLRGLADW